MKKILLFDCFYTAVFGKSLKIKVKNDK